MRGDEGYGLPRARCALAMTGSWYFPVIPNQCAHWCGNPFPFWKAGRERSAILPRPGGLKTSSCFPREAWSAMALSRKNHPAAIGSRVKQFCNSFGPGTGSGPGAAPCVSDLACQSRHHSDRLAGILTPFRRRDKPGSRCPVIQLNKLYHALYRFTIPAGGNIEKRILRQF